MERRARQFLSYVSRATVPSIATYISLSIVVAAITIYYVHSAFEKHPELHDILREEVRNSSAVDSEIAKKLADLRSVRVIYYVISHPTFVWVMVNTFYAMLTLTAQIIISVFMRGVSRHEENNLRQNFLSLLLFDIVFLSMVTPYTPSLRILPWCLWFGITAFFAIIQDIILQRFKYMSPNAHRFGGRLSWLCFSLFVVSTTLLLFLLRNRSIIDSTSLSFLLTDAIYIAIRASHALLRCILSSGIVGGSSDSIRHYLYNLDLGGSILADSIVLANGVRLLLLNEISFTSIFFFYHIRHSYSLINSALQRHSRHKVIFDYIKNTFPCHRSEAKDLCVVCWEEMTSTRQLPCEHSFHDWCLMWWLEQDASCPTCRRPIPTPPTLQIRPQQVLQPQARTQDVQLQFGGQGLAGFRIPRFTIQFAHNFGGFVARPALDDAALAGMAETVRELFPQLPLAVIVEDLRLTGSTQATIDNVLEGRLDSMPFIEEEEEEEDAEESESEEIEQPEAGDMMFGERRHRRSERLPSSCFDDDAIDEGNIHAADLRAKKRQLVAEQRMLYLRTPQADDLRAAGFTA